MGRNDWEADRPEAMCGRRGIGDAAPGAVVASFPTVPVPNLLPGDVFTLAPFAPATLSAGATYWLVNPSTPGVEVGWGTYASTPSLPGAYRLSSSGSWNSFSANVAFRVEGMVVPEPSTALLLGLPLSLLSRVDRRR